MQSLQHDAGGKLEVVHVLDVYQFGETREYGKILTNQSRQSQCILDTNPDHEFQLMSENCVCTYVCSYTMGQVNHDNTSWCQNGRGGVPYMSKMVTQWFESQNDITNGYRSVKC